MIRHRMILPAALLVLVCGTDSRAQNVPVIVTSEYRAETKSLLIHATNNSGKNIVAYFISVRRRLADGTPDKQGSTGQFNDLLHILVRIQMAKDPDAYERRLNESSNGLFTAGTTRDSRMEKSDNSGVEVRAEVVF
jgi:hypothetical protein